MVLLAYRRDGEATTVTLRPVETPSVVWRDLGGTVRILKDGRRVIVHRQ